MEEIEQLVIAGSGCAGLTAAIYAARANLNPLVIEGDQPGGSLTKAKKVDNFPGFPEGISGAELRQRMRQQAEHLGARFSHTSVIKAHSGENDQKTLILSNGQNITTKTLIIATGMNETILPFPENLSFSGRKELREKLLNGKGLSTCAMCDGAFYNGKTVVVIGDGKKAYDSVAYLSNICAKVYWVQCNETILSCMQETFIRQNENIECLEQQIPVGFSTDSENCLNGLKLQKADKTYTLPCSCVFLQQEYANSRVFKDFVDMDENGIIYTRNDLRSFIPVSTSIPGVYAAGACTRHDCVYALEQAVVAASMGVQAVYLAGLFVKESLKKNN